LRSSLLWRAQWVPYTKVVIDTFVQSIQVRASGLIASVSCVQRSNDLNNGNSPTVKLVLW
jgi:hypothetical protein